MDSAAAQLVWACLVSIVYVHGPAIVCAALLLIAPYMLVLWSPLGTDWHYTLAGLPRLLGGLAASARPPLGDDDWISGTIFRRKVHAASATASKAAAAERRSARGVPQAQVRQRAAAAVLGIFYSYCALVLLAVSWLLRGAVADSTPAHLLAILSWAFGALQLAGVRGGDEAAGGAATAAAALAGCSLMLAIPPLRVFTDVVGFRVSTLALYMWRCAQRWDAEANQEAASDGSLSDATRLLHAIVFACMRCAWAPAVAIYSWAPVLARLLDSPQALERSGARAAAVLLSALLVFNFLEGAGVLLAAVGGDVKAWKAWLRRRHGVRYPVTPYTGV